MVNAKHEYKAGAYENVAVFSKKKKKIVQRFGHKSDY